LSHLYIKCIILPRQARDKHRENSKKVPFSRSTAHGRITIPSTAAAAAAAAAVAAAAADDGSADLGSASGVDVASFAFFDCYHGGSSAGRSSPRLRPSADGIGNLRVEVEGLGLGCVYAGEKTALFAPFIYKMHYFTKTGSGQT
jgi:hypothetical protein